MSSLNREPSQPSQVVPMLCRNNCGFYGNPITGLCSKCQKVDDEMKKSKQQAITDIPASSTTTPSPPSSSSSVHMFTRSSPMDITGRNITSSSSYDVISSSAPEHMLFTPNHHPVPNDTQLPLLASPPSSTSILSETPLLGSSLSSPDYRSRCFMCKKKLGLTGLQCKCGHYYCALHRYSDKHNCEYDYKKEAQNNLSEKNPKVSATKIDPI
jgi:hypothetical protein